MPSRKPNRHKPATGCKVRFQPEAPGQVADAIRATPIARGRFRIDAIPFIARGVSFHDLVQASPTEVASVNDFSRVIQKSGHRTIHFTTTGLANKATALPALLTRLVEAGCSHDTRDGKFHAVNVPPLVELAAVGELLTQQGVPWSVADGA
jgi:hypothetical protein